MAGEHITSGKVLLADPFLQDPYFKRSVVLLCEHHEEGSLGFILNKMIDMKITELITDFPEFEAEIFYGGPVQTDTIHYIHCLGDLLEDSLEISDGLYWGGDYEKLKSLIASNLVQPKDIRFFVGYAGWSGGQLGEELTTGSWVMADMESNYVLEEKINDLWQNVMNKKGNVYSVIAQMPEAANLN